MLGAPITTLVAEMARKSEAAVQSLNARSPMLSTDPALAGKHGTFFNWLSREIR